MCTVDLGMNPGAKNGVWWRYWLRNKLLVLEGREGRGEGTDTHLVSCHIEPSDNDKPTLPSVDAN